MQEDRSLLIIAMDAMFVAHRRTDGSVAWSYRFESDGFLGTSREDQGTIEIAIHGGRIYAAFGLKLVCLDYKTGALIGEADIEAGHRRPTMLFDVNQLFVLGRTKLMCFDLNGRRLWEAPHDLQASKMNALYYSPVLALPGNIVRGDVMNIH